MHRIPGQITERLTADFGPNANGWTYVREEESTDAVAAYGYRLESRWPSRFVAVVAR